MRPIKFRGRNFFTGEFVYAQQIRSTDDGFDFWVNDDWIHCTDCAQLVDFDEVGNEVYEGDTVISEYGDEFLAELASAVLTDEGFLHTGISFEILKVKEA